MESIRLTSLPGLAIWRWRQSFPQDIPQTRQLAHVCFEGGEADLA